MKDKDLHQSRQIGGIKTQIKFLHAKLKKNDYAINTMLLLIILLGCCIIALTR